MIDINASMERARGSQEAGCRSLGVEFAPDAPLEGDGFELSVPRQRRAPLATDNQGEEVRFALDSLLEEDATVISALAGKLSPKISFRS